MNLILQYNIDAMLKHKVPKKIRERGPLNEKNIRLLAYFDGVTSLNSQQLVLAGLKLPGIELKSLINYKYLKFEKYLFRSSLGGVYTKL